jgi:hypothetical protein
VRTRILAGAVAIVALAALALGRAPGRPHPTPSPARPPLGAEAGSKAPPPRVVDPAGIRDVFHPADGPPWPSEAPARDATAGVPEVDSPAPPPGPRLVGLVSRAGRVLAALSADGEVALAGPGETAAGVTVLAVDDEGVRIRRPDGSEETLPLQ